MVLRRYLLAAYLARLNAAKFSNCVFDLEVRASIHTCRELRRVHRRDTRVAAIFCVSAGTALTSPPTQR